MMVHLLPQTEHDSTLTLHHEGDKAHVQGSAQGSVGELIQQDPEDDGAAIPLASEPTLSKLLPVVG